MKHLASSVTPFIDKKFIREKVLSALNEDFAFEDITSNGIFDSPLLVTAKIVARENGILCGLDFAKESFFALDAGCRINADYKDGDAFQKNDPVLTIESDANSVLKAERTALNFLSFLSGISTQTANHCKKGDQYSLGILDTRKTIPLHRLLSKYAVLCGGGINHRLHLADMGMIKDNHIAFCGSLEKAILKFRQANPQKPLEVEVENLENLNIALENEVDGILLDNMDRKNLRSASKYIKKWMQKNPDRKHPLFYEASGGFHLGNIRKLKGLGIPLVSLSTITMQFKSINFSLDVQEKKAEISEH